MIKLWKFEAENECAFIGGLFHATDEEIKNLIGKTIYFGEWAGYHSEVEITIDDCDIELISDNPIVVSAIEDFGLNPLEFFDFQNKMPQ